ncbi:hypothetical protein FA95DRAFT_1575150 [Auriscalpium vulgare]|uniref:Uncharacterized protein n=1 Tax=Auriscalpium vulgare TaxID=40419 RepID=A0ACB8RGX9_9AGAM|nr:hypothetical protein FA95DRAFT_1575150 [Auriscalpium vulgare]
MLTRPAPCLEVFQIVDTQVNADEADLCYPANFLGGCAPRLRSFYSDTFDFGLWPSSVLDNVATLDINGTIAVASSSRPMPNLDDAFAALERMRALKVLHWYEHLPRSNLLQDSPVRKVVSLPGLTHLSFGGELVACAQLLRYIDVPSTTLITLLPHCLTSSEADLTTFFHHTTSWLSRHAPFSPLAVSISTVKEDGVAVANKYIKLLAWHADDIEVDSLSHDDDDEVIHADLTISFDQGPKHVPLAWDDIQMVKACFNVCASPQLRQLSLCAEEWQRDAWREILGAPAAAALWRVVAIRAAATELLSFWRPSLVSLCLSKPNGKSAHKTFVKHLTMLPYWLAQRANAGYPLKKLELDFEVDQTWRSNVEGSVDLLWTYSDGELVAMSQ